MNNKKILLVGVVITILSLVLVACGGSSGSAGVTVTLKAQDIKFDLKEIKGKVNQPITINYINEGSLEHNFIVRNFNVKETVQAGQKKTFTFTPTTAGKFTFLCDVPGHSEAGMTGNLIIEP